MHPSVPIAVLLLLVSLSNLGYLAHRKWSRPSTQVLDHPSYTYRGHDFPQYLPIPNSMLDEVLLTVEESVRYPVAGSASDDDWFSLQLGSGSAGYVRLGSEERIFVVNMFHELHCLRLLNLAFDPVKVVLEGHIQHCLNYLRQMTMCKPDLTLERMGWEERNFEVERVGATHVCRDWSMVYAAVEDNYARWNASKTG
ncbi:hypothetical protein BDZ89DRAFT_1061014 [Hymenopellis radicata]|nr:hypothetical protein BDZ89DRAFT_1061014 [Hymenopellis radicata]